MAQRDAKLPATKEAAIAKLTATECAQWVIDQAVQMFGGRGVQVSNIAGNLSRDPGRSESTKERHRVQKLIISRGDWVRLSRPEGRHRRGQAHRQEARPQPCPYPHRILHPEAGTSLRLFNGIERADAPSMSAARSAGTAR